MKMAIIITASILASGVIGFMVGKKLSFPSQETINELDGFVERLEELNKNPYSQLAKNSSILISVLQQLDHKNDAEAKATIIDELGNTYYIYTYENERDLNSPEIENILIQIDELAKTRPSFEKVKQYKPNE